jgi:hypothetical protein
MRSQWVAIVLGLTLVVAATVAAPAASERQAAAGSRDFQASFALISTSVPCPADVPPNTTECRALTVQPSYPVPGLGWISESTYTLPLGLGPPTCPRDLGKPLAATVRLGVAGRDRLRTVRGSTVRGSRGGVGGAAGVHDHRRHRPVRRGLRKRGARARGLSRGRLRRLLRDVDGNADRPWAPPHGAQAERSCSEDGARGEGCEERPCDL